MAVEMRERSAEILAAAAQVFTEHGYDAASVSDIAAAVGLSKATLYHYFDSKETVVFAIIMDALRGLEGSVRAELDTLSEADAPTRLRAFMRAHASYFEANYHAFVTMLSGVGSLTPERRREMIGVRDAYETLLREVVQEGVAAGSFRELRPEVGARLVLSSLNWMSRWFRPGGPQSAAEVAEDYADVILDGLRSGR